MRRAADALTTAERVRNWWTRDCDLGEAVGGLGAFRFYDVRVVTHVKITALRAPVHVRWTTLSSTASGDWQGTTIGWGYFLVSQQQYLETGKGASAPDLDFARVIRR